MGDRSSVSTFPLDHEIFISEAYQFDAAGKLERRIENTGILVPGTEIELMELIEPNGETRGQEIVEAEQT